MMRKFLDAIKRVLNDLYCQHARRCLVQDPLDYTIWEHQTSEKPWRNYPFA